MMCAFDGPPKIFRFYGRGTVVEPHEDAFPELLAKFATQPAARNIIVVDLDCIRDSCGYGVPEYEFRRQRDSMHNWLESKTEDDLQTYFRDNNAASLDGLPGLKFD